MNFKKISFSHLVIVCLINDLAMATSSHRRRRLDDLDIFFFECKCFTLRAKRDNITKFVESVYLKVLFRVPSRVETAIVVSRQTQFGVSMVWNLSGWHFGFVNVKGFKKKNNIFCHTQESLLPSDQLHLWACHYLYRSFKDLWHRSQVTCF